MQPQAATPGWNSVRRWWAIGGDALRLWLDRNAFSHAGARAS